MRVTLKTVLLAATALAALIGAAIIGVPSTPYKSGSALEFRIVTH